MGRFSCDVLLNDRDLGIGDFRDDGYVTVWGHAEDEEVIWFWGAFSTVFVLDHSAVLVDGAWFDGGIVVMFGMAPNGGHFVIEGFVVEAFHVFDTLPFLSKVVA